MTSTRGEYVVLYDGQCRFCTGQMQNLLRLARPGAVRAVDFQAPGALDHFPSLSHDACMQAMHLVTPDGRIYRGFEAAVQAVATRRWLLPLAYGYYLPGIRWLCDGIYAWIAAHRYRLLGRTACPEGTCALHARPRGS
jgi:predicted DCC family thiol-disulfide oxidoreductase YuxK